ncbi:MAG: transcription-repair coupling factor [Clostridia bacterium]|nr:transcription-repair coupling factor [Clostridia bacterium]
MSFKTEEARIITEAVKGEPEYGRILSRLEAFKASGSLYRDDPIMATGLADTPRAALCYALASESSVTDENSCSIICVPDEKTAYNLARFLSAFSDGILVFSQRDYVFYNISATSREFEHDRINAIRAIASGRAKMVICVPEALLGILPPKERCAEEIRISVGDEYPTEELLEKLVYFGYTRADTVEGRGQFSARGDILDVFPPDMQSPVRMEFFGDELDCAGTFDILTQRRTENVTDIVISPAKEILISEDEQKKIEAEIDELLSNAQKRRMMAERSGDKLKVADYEGLITKLLSEKASLAEGTLACIDKYLPSVLAEKSTLLDYADGCIFLFDLARITERLESYEMQLAQTVTFLAEHGEINLRKTSYCENYEYLLSKIREKPTLVCNTFTQSSNMKFSGIYNFRTKATTAFTRDMEVLCDDLEDYRERGFRSIILAGSVHSAGVLGSLMTERSIKSIVVSPSEIKCDSMSAQHVYITYKDEQTQVFPGFELTTSRLAFLTEGNTEYTATKAAARRAGRSKSSAKRILSYSDLNVGDYVVHTVHGIGRYDGIKTLTVGGITKDYIAITYAGNDVNYVPADQLDRVSRYAGAGENVKLSKIGGQDWQKTKTRVKKAAKDMAKELIELYAKRRRLPGYAFGADSEWQRDFEGKFIYEETDGQLEAISEIKKDMQESYPMDRLLCGDVGFGKTEVALRAVFKCIAEGKQAAILVPTTILAWQHYETALSRFADFPCNIDVVSRFKSPKQIKETLKNLRIGNVDLIIGTHRLLSKDIEFKDLGLLVVDEEQRFGVAHKEKLKQLAQNIDVLTLTATPIPRTLNMAMAGIRDMSVLEEAPQDRYPVQTYVMEHDNEVIGEAIKRELRRGGQVFYLRNKVDGIEGTAETIRKMVPDANIAIAHGQMTEDVLSDIWRRLVDGDIDVLVCTTIIETGVDVPNANTIIIEHADRMGLSQLHQIRGRVGRSTRRAYAYLTYDGTKALSEIAQKRLEAVREYTEFGSGFKIAMRDLEIRGAGNLLGAEQSGHLEAVGYDLYIKLLEEAVLEEKGEALPKKCECTIDFGRNAYIPDSYISVPGARIEAYKKIAAIESDADADDVTDELLDRYGEMPKSVVTLIWISKIRARGEKAKIKRLEVKSGRLNVYPESPSKEILREMYAVFGKALLYCAGANPYYSIKITSEKDVADFTDKIFNLYSPKEE